MVYSKTNNSGAAIAMYTTLNDSGKQQQPSKEIKLQERLVPGADTRAFQGTIISDSSYSNQSVPQGFVQGPIDWAPPAVRSSTDQYPSMILPCNEALQSFGSMFKQSASNETYIDAYGTHWTPIKGTARTSLDDQVAYLQPHQQFPDDAEQYGTQRLGHRSIFEDHFSSSSQAQHSIPNANQRLDSGNNTDMIGTFSSESVQTPNFNEKDQEKSDSKRKRGYESDCVQKKRIKTTDRVNSKKVWRDFKNRVDIKKLIIKDPNGYTLPSSFSERKYKASEQHPLATSTLPFDIDPEDPGDFIRRFPNHLHGQPLLWLTEIAGGEGWSVRKIYDYLPDPVKQTDLHHHEERAKKRDLNQGKGALASYQPWGRYTKSVVEARKSLMSEHNGEDEISDLISSSARQVHMYDIEELFNICQHGKHYVRNMNTNEKDGLLQSLHNLSQKSSRASFSATDTAKENVRAEFRKGSQLLYLLELLRNDNENSQSPDYNREQADILWAAKFYEWLMSTGKVGLTSLMAQFQKGKLELKMPRLLEIQQELLSNVVRGSKAADLGDVGDERHTYTQYGRSSRTWSEQAFILSTWRSGWALELLRLLQGLLEPLVPVKGSKKKSTGREDSQESFTDFGGCGKDTAQFDGKG